MEQSTIKITKKLKADLARERNYPHETYEAVIHRLLENSRNDDELSGEMIRDIEEGLADIKAGRTYTSEQVKEMLGL